MRERWLTSKAMAFPERLKRGLGSAFLDALELPRQEVHEHLYRCITRDPRCDGQIEHRADYYALLALHTGLPVGRLADHLRRRDDESQFTSRTSLTIETLIRLETRGSAEARETLRQYISRGQWWDWALEGLVETGDASAWDDLLPAILTRFPTPDELSLEIRMITRVPWDVWSGDPCVSEALTLARERARPDSARVSADERPSGCCSHPQLVSS